MSSVYVIRGAVDFNTGLYYEVVDSSTGNVLSKHGTVKEAMQAYDDVVAIPTVEVKPIKVGLVNASKPK